MKNWTMDSVQSQREELAGTIKDAEFDYDYPLDASGNEMNLHPDSELHKFILQEIIDKRATQSNLLAKTAHKDWRKIDNTLTAFLPSDEADALEKSRDPKKPVNVVIPMQYASLDMWLTYLHGVFCQDVIHHYRGRGQRGAKVRAALMERIVHKQSQWFAESLRLQAMWRDAFSYGIGAVAPVWRKHKARRPMHAEVNEVVKELLPPELKRQVDVGDIVRYLEEQTLFEGSELRNIDPYKLLPDPNTSLNDFQRSEFWGYLRRTNVMDLLREEADPESRRFNGKYVRMYSDRNMGKSTFYTDESGRNAVYDTELTTGSAAARYYENAVDELHMFIHIIPKEWGLGEQEYPMKWMFTVAGDKIVTQAEPVDLDHGMWPGVVCGPNTTGHDTLPISHLTVGYPAQQTADWFIRTMVANQRKLQNDMLVVNPHYIEMKDVLTPGPGKIIRTKRTAYGQENIQNYIQQLQVQNTTEGHMANANMFFEFMNRVQGTGDVMQGDLSNMPERPTARGMSIAEAGATSRTQRIAAVISDQSMVPLGYQMAYNTLQFMSEHVEVSVLGRYEEWLRRELGMGHDGGDVDVAPEDLEASFEVEPLNVAQAVPESLETMTEVVKTVLAGEEAQADLMSTLSTTGLFLAWARKAGFEDVHEFVREGGGQNMQPQVMGDEQIQQQAEAGNLVPFDSGAGVGG